jgi:hypothetical protein
LITQDLEALIGEPAALSERHSEGVELLARPSGADPEHEPANRWATSAVTVTWSDIMSRSKPSPSTMRAHSRSTPGSVPGPKFGTLTPSFMIGGYPGVLGELDGVVVPAGPDSRLVPGYRCGSKLLTR